MARLLESAELQKTPWFAWLMAPFCILVSLPIILPLGFLAILSIPYFGIFPDHHAHLYDFEGTPEQKEFLALRRSRYRRLGLRRRIRRAFRFGFYARMGAPSA